MAIADLIKKGSFSKPINATHATLATYSPNLAPTVAEVATVAAGTKKTRKPVSTIQKPEQQYQLKVYDVCVGKYHFTMICPIEMTLKEVRKSVKNQFCRYSNIDVKERGQ